MSDVTPTEGPTYTLRNAEEKFSMVFMGLDGVPLGVLKENDYGHLEFTGDAEHSAKILFRFVTALWDNKRQIEKITAAQESSGALKH
jgi:hypothetical protein